MARKSTKSSRSTSKSRSTTGRSRKKSSRTASRGSLLARLGQALGGLSPRAQSSGKSAGRSKKKTPVLDVNLSPDRKLDIVGIALAFVGLLTTLSLLSPKNSSFIGSWVTLIGQGFGWGMYLLPFGLLVGGLWLVLRHFESIPQVVMERALGFLLLFVNFLAWLHLYAVADSGQDAFVLAQQSQGGGYLGAFFLRILNLGLGLGGAAIALSAWLLIALTMALDVTVIELFGWVAPPVNLLRNGLSSLWRKFRELLPKPKKPEPVFHPAEAAPHSAAPADNGLVSGLRPGAMQAYARAWSLPPLDEILEAGGEVPIDDEYDRQRACLIEETLGSFGAPAKVVEINRGPTITQFGVEPDFIETRSGRTRVRVSKISGLADDLALALAARTIRIQAPVPGAGYVGIEVPNDEISMVALRDIVESDTFKRLKSPLAFALGQNVAGEPVAANLASMPHLLIAGATGSGKSVCVNALISCLLINNTPNELRMIMVDPKRVELTGYNGIPHLLAPVVVELERVVGALQWVTREMDMRYRKLSDAGARNIQDYNAACEARGENKLPYLVVIIDELADLMMLAPDETERSVTRLAQLARATGIHLVIATQRPSVDVVTGLIKANFPARIAFAVASGTDSRVILDQPGAERLLGRGDMLFQAPEAPAPVRLQGVFVSDEEIRRLVYYWQGFNGMETSTQVAVGGIVDSLPSNLPLKQLPMWEEANQADADPMMEEAVDLIRRQGRASISMLQRRLRIGYTRAARLIETLEEKGIVSAPEPGTGVREVLDYGPTAPPVED